jgi:hypothetical protein
MADSRIKSVSDLISVFFDRETTSKGESYGSFRSAWKEIAGERLAGHSRPVDIRHGILIVETEHQGWTQLLQYQQERMLDDIGHRFPELEIRGIAWRLATGGVSWKGAAEPVGQTPTESAAPKEPTAPQEPQPEAKAAPLPSPADALPPELRAAFERLKRNNREP